MACNINFRTLISKDKMDYSININIILIYIINKSILNKEKCNNDQFEYIKLNKILFGGF